MIKLKELLKESKEQINEGTLPTFQSLKDVSNYDRNWGQIFKDLGTGYPRIDYGPRESDMYDWNSRANYQAATKEYHAHMTKVAKKLNTAVKELDGLYKVWDKIIPHLIFNNKPNSNYEKRIQKPGFLPKCLLNVVRHRIKVLPQRKQIDSFRI